MAAKQCDPKTPVTHIINFFYDSDNGCALTAIINGARFHVIADASKLDSESGEGDHVYEEYLELLNAVQRKDNEEDESTKPQNEPEAEYSESPGGDSQDSGVDVSSDPNQKCSRDAKDRNPRSELKKSENEDPEHDLQNWMLSCLGDEVSKLTSNHDQNPKNQSLSKWYNSPAHFFELTVKDHALAATQLNETAELRTRLDELLPKLSLPKYLRALDLPWLLPSDVTVLSTSDEPPPLHPCIVEVTHEPSSSDNDSNRKKRKCFFKAVDPTQPQPTKRELKILAQVEKLGLHKQFRVPRLEGLVAFDKSDKTHIMGFLLTQIEDPTPLTTLLPPDSDEKDQQQQQEEKGKEDEQDREQDDSEEMRTKRHKWSDEVQRIVSILHKHKIIWGDAKADNFMVDKNDDLWIIDFGGSYTEGWIDEELVETQEGDEMGTRKTVEALEETEACGGGGGGGGGGAEEKVEIAGTEEDDEMEEGLRNQSDRKRTVRTGKNMESRKRRRSEEQDENNVQERSDKENDSPKKVRRG